MKSGTPRWEVDLRFHSGYAASASAPVTLTAEQARRLVASGVVDVGPGPAAGQWVVRGRNKVGAAYVGDVELRIDPKVPVARLLFLLGHARNPRACR